MVVLEVQDLLAMEAVQALVEVMDLMVPVMMLEVEEIMVLVEVVVEAALQLMEMVLLVVLVPLELSGVREDLIHQQILPMRLQLHFLLHLFSGKILVEMIEI